VLVLGQGGADDDDRLAQRDQDEGLAALGKVTALDRPVRRMRAAKTRNREHAADDAPDRDSLEVHPQRAGRQHRHHEAGAPDLHERVSAAHHEPERAERVGQGGGHRQADQHEQHEHEPDLQPIRIEPVRYPRRVGPGQPHHRQQDRGLHRARDRRRAEQMVRELCDREDVHQVEEQLDVGDSLAA
jgi:hypothetical protein